MRKAISILDQAWFIYWIQCRQICTQDEQKSVCHILFQEHNVQLSKFSAAQVSKQVITEEETR